MQEEAARAQALVRRAVAGVAHDGVADGGHVDAYLVRASAFEDEFEQGGWPRRARRRPALAHGVGRPGRLAGRRDGHFGRGARRTPDRGLDFPPVVGHRALDQGQVAALHGAGGELLDE